MSVRPERPPSLILPDDEYNRELIQNVHPPDWVNPEPAERYNLVVLGAGTAGLVTAAIAAGLGARVALVEKHLIGGDCLNVGCVPSKGVIRASRAWAEIRRADTFGLTVPNALREDFGAVMARMRKLRARISHVDSARRFKSLGVDVFIGEGRFTGPKAMEVNGHTLRFARAAVCTGARAAELPIPGLKEAGAFTNETVFELTRLPRRIAVIGAGPIGCELAQAFARFGSQVTVFQKGRRVLPREDPDAAQIVDRAMSRDGVQFISEASIERVSLQGAGKVIHYRRHEQAADLEAEEILVGIGRRPNVEGLNLEAAGVAYDSRKGIAVNPRLQTSVPHIFAAGDVCSVYKFTHAADAMAQIVIQNALFPHPLGLGYASVESLIIPWCTYTAPEIAHVGLYEHQAKDQRVGIDTFTVTLDEVDRAVLDGEDEGFARVHVKKGTDRILGATIVAAHAGDLISEITLAMKGRLGLGTIAGTIHPYPTQGEVLRKVANAWRRTTLTAGKKAVLRRLFTWMR